MNSLYLLSWHIIHTWTYEILRIDRLIKYTVLQLGACDKRAAFDILLFCEAMHTHTVYWNYHKTIWRWLMLSTNWIFLASILIWMHNADDKFDFKWNKTSLCKEFICKLFRYIIAIPLYYVSLGMVFFFSFFFQAIQQKQTSSDLLKWSNFLPKI